MSFIRDELSRVLHEGQTSQNSAMTLRAALRLIDVVAEHQSPAIRANALEVALYALAHARAPEPVADSLFASTATLSV